MTNKRCSQENILNALKEIQDLSGRVKLTQIANKWGVAPRTLGDHCKRNGIKITKPTNAEPPIILVLSEAEEERVVKWVKMNENMNIPVTNDTVKDAVREMLAQEATDNKTKREKGEKVLDRYIPNDFVDFIPSDR